MTLTVGSLFSGIGGMDLGLERAGHTVIWQSEIDPYCNKVLKKHWPTVPNLGDITTIDWGKIERPDIICGGYPCQPFSTAGKRNGTADPRHLWPAMHNAICLLRPKYAIMENVRGHLSLGFGDVLADLAEIGYDAEWQVIPAAAVGALHKRDRVFIVAYPNNARGRTPERGIDGNGSAQIKKRQNVAQSGVSRRGAEVAYPDGERSHRTEVNSAEGRQSAFVDVAGRGEAVANADSRRQQKRDTPIWGVSVFNAVSCQQFAQQWATEPNVGRVAHGVSDRVDRLRGLGNAVVPQVAELVGRLIGEHAKQLK
jgi:DNA (cytosine-5)-methyltransferase 1